MSARIHPLQLSRLTGYDPVPPTSPPRLRSPSTPPQPHRITANVANRNESVAGLSHTQQNVAASWDDTHIVLAPLEKRNDSDGRTIKERDIRRDRWARKWSDE